MRHEISYEMFPERCPKFDIRGLETFSQMLKTLKIHVEGQFALQLQLRLVKANVVFQSHAQNDNDVDITCWAPRLWVWNNLGENFVAQYIRKNNDLLVTDRILCPLKGELKTFNRNAPKPLYNFTFTAE